MSYVLLDVSDNFLNVACYLKKIKKSLNYFQSFHQSQAQIKMEQYLLKKYIFFHNKMNGSSHSYSPS